MENVMNLMQGFETVFSLYNVMACLLGCVLGLIVGALPGIGPLAGIALLLPLTYNFNPTTAIIMLGALYYSNMYGGAFSSILLGIPGDSAAVVTMLDGYPMAKKGRASQALFTSNLSSFIGGLIGMVVLTFIGPALANVGLKFGPAEMTALLIMAMTSIGSLMGEKPGKGIVITCMGILIASIGMDTLTGSPRYDFGVIQLLGGIPFSSFVIGACGFSEIIGLMSTRNDPSEFANVNQKLTIRESFLSKHDLKLMLPPSIRAGFLGTALGVLPGAGATAGSFLCYSSQKAFKNEVPLGTGSIEGLAACESGNNATAASSFAPLLALGIPGSGTGAVLLGGLMMWGLNPGPLLFTKSPDFAWGLIASLFLANLLALLISLGTIPLLMNILKVPVKYMIPSITVICVVGAYATSNSMYGVLIMFVAGILGFLLDKNGYPIAPMLLAYVLAPMLESNMRKAFILSKGSLGIFVERPISLVLLLVTSVIILYPAVRGIIKKAKAS